MDANGQPRRITLELDSDAEPITGRIGEEGGDSRPFTGWLGLAAALSWTLGGGEDGTDPAASRPRQSE
jgi:hypothetical protein